MHKFYRNPSVPRGGTRTVIHLTYKRSTCDSLNQSSVMIIHQFSNQLITIIRFVIVNGQINNRNYQSSIIIIINHRSTMIKKSEACATRHYTFIVKINMPMSKKSKSKACRADSLLYFHHHHDRYFARSRLVPRGPIKIDQAHSRRVVAQQAQNTGDTACTNKRDVYKIHNQIGVDVDETRRRKFILLTLCNRANPVYPIAKRDPAYVP